MASPSVHSDLQSHWQLPSLLIKPCCCLFTPSRRLGPQWCLTVAEFPRRMKFSTFQCLLTTGTPSFGKGLCSCFCPHIHRGSLLLRSCVSQVKTLCHIHVQCLWMTYFWLSVCPHHTSSSTAWTVSWSPARSQDRASCPAHSGHHYLDSVSWDWGDRFNREHFLTVHLFVLLDGSVPYLHLTAPCKVTGHRST